MAAEWAPAIGRLAPAKNAEALTDVKPLLARLVEAYDQGTIAALLDVDKSTVSLWVRGKREIGAVMRARILEVHDVLSRVHQIFNPTLASRWLVGSEPMLGGARPIDVLGIRGAAPVIEALEAFAAGGFA
jgi:head-tail adaptor